jgi:hypothetical protein
VFSHSFSTKFSFDEIDSKGTKEKKFVGVAGMNVDF